MRILDVKIPYKSRSDRIEIFPFFDLHVGKSNCNEDAIQKQIQEVIKRDARPDRHVIVVLGGDAVNAISASDRRRFDFSDVADWVASGTPAEIKEALADLPKREIKRVEKLFSPIKHLIVGALEGNHEKSLRKYHDMDVQAELCSRLECENLSDEALLRLHFVRNYGRNNHHAVHSVVVYLRHGYGAGRSIGVEPAKLQAMLDEWECADICFSGHTHTFCSLAPKTVAILPKRGKIADKLLWKYRVAANPGSWLDSHSIGRGTYESSQCYPARAFMTCKAVIWPDYRHTQGGRDFSTPKVEIRSYPLL